MTSEHSKSLVYFYAGCEETHESFVVYDKFERKQAFISNAVTRLSKFSFGFMHTSNALVPVAFLIFGFPPPELWIPQFIVQLVFRPILHSIGLAFLRKISWFDFSLLFNQQTFHGFYLNWLIAMLSSAIFYISMIGSLLLFTGLCFYISAMVEDIKVRMTLINRSIQQSSASKIKSDEINIRVTLVKEIRYHNHIRGWVYHSPFPR